MAKIRAGFGVFQICPVQTGTRSDGSDVPCAVSNGICLSGITPVN